MKNRRGFSLVELMVVIVALGVLAGSVAVFLHAPVRAYFDSARRAALADAADLASRRIARELQGALPNSARVASSGTQVLLEFIPIDDAGRYRSARSAGAEPAGDDPLDFTDPADASFQVLGPPVEVPAGAHVVIYNLGAGDLDAHVGLNRRRVVNSPGPAQTIAFVGGAPWPSDSADHRFYLVSGPVTFACTPGAGGSGRIERFSGYPFQAIQPADTTSAPLAAATRSLLVDRVVDCSFALTAVLANLNAVAIHLRLGDGTEDAGLYTQVHLGNTP